MVTVHPVDQFVRYAQEKDLDLIVIGSRGKGGLADVTMGSTSRRVLRRCSKPLLDVRLPEDENRSIKVLPIPILKLFWSLAI